MHANIKQHIEEIKDRYVPDSELSFLSKDSIENSLNIDIPNSVSKMIIENGVSFYLISKVEDNLYVKLKASKQSNNIGILKTTLKKITEKTPEK